MRNLVTRNNDLNDMKAKQKSNNQTDNSNPLMSMGDFEKLNGYNYIKSLNGFVPKDYLCKYLPFSRFEDSVKDGKISLSFCSPKCWTDPFEHIYWRLSYGVLNDFQVPEIACFCMTEDKATTTSAAAMWKEYQSGSDKMVRLAFNHEVLFSHLDAYAASQGCEFYVSEMNYGYTRDGLENGEPLRELQRGSFDVGTYLKLMSLKRQAFSYEHEIRIFLVGNSSKQDRITVDMQCTAELIPKITIGPLQPFSYNDPRQEIYDELSSRYNSQYEKRIRKLIPSTTVNRATIYKLSKSNSVSSVQQKLNEVWSH